MAGGSMGEVAACARLCKSAPEHRGELPSYGARKTRMRGEYIFQERRNQGAEPGTNQSQAGELFRVLTLPSGTGDLRVRARV